MSNYNKSMQHCCIDVREELFLQHRCIKIGFQDCNCISSTRFPMNNQASDQIWSNAAIGTSPSILNEIHCKEKNIVILQREINHLEENLMICSKYDLKLSYRGSVSEIISELKNDFKTSFPSCLSVAEDISLLLKMFQEVSEADSFKLSLVTVNTDMCKKFHTDINDMRLLCTYVGQGTLWLPQEVLKTNKGFTNTELQIEDDDLVQQTNTGDVVILKGALYPNPETNPVLHKSPTIESKGEKRLLLRIDTDKFLNFS